MDGSFIRSWKRFVIGVTEKSEIGMWVRFDAVVHGCLQVASLQRELLVEISWKNNDNKAVI